MKGFRKQRTTPDAGYGHPGLPRADTAALNPTFTTAAPMARMTGRDTHPDPRRAGETASLAAACPFGRMTGRDTARRCAPAGGRHRPKATQLPLGPFRGPPAAPTTPPPFPDSRPPPS
ncbi:hypothetical protein GCM10009642_02940 [Nocardiopsis metallicus]